MEANAAPSILTRLLDGDHPDRSGYRFYEEPIKNLLEAMDRGVCPWNNPCLTMQIANAKTRLPYRGFNQFILAATTLVAGYRSPFWMTLKQANEFGGRIKTGARSTMIVYRKVFDSPENPRKRASEMEDSGSTNRPWLGESSIDKSTERTNRFTRLFYFRAFNYDQTEGVQFGFEPYPTVRRPAASDGAEAAAKAILAGFKNGPKIVHTQSIVERGAGSYSEKEDRICLRPPQDYVTSGEYWGALFHELIHSCAAPNRLDFRKNSPKARFGDKAYALDELTCEIGANLLLVKAGLENEGLRENSAAYLRSWKARIGDNPRMLIWAADRASRAVNWVLGISPEAAKDPAPSAPAAMETPAAMPLPSVAILAHELERRGFDARPGFEPLPAT